MPDDRNDRYPRDRREQRGGGDTAPECGDAGGPIDAGRADDLPDAARDTSVSARDASTPPDRATLDALAGQLVWRIGRTSDDAPLTVRVGLAGSAPTFAELPRLRSASDAEVQQAVDAGEVRVEWVGPRGR